MKIGLFAPTATPTATPSSIRQLGEIAEACGFHSLWVPEHVVTFDERPLDPQSDPELGVLDPFATLSFVAALTSTIRLGTGVTLISQRQPLFAAKEVATIDFLSGGRLDLGVGTGWVPEEFTALQLRRDQRGRLTDRNIDIMKTLWMDPVSVYSDRGYELPPCRAYPKPVQVPHPPIHVGGSSDAALRRVARCAQGWYAFKLDPDELAARLQVLGRCAEALGRSLDEITVSVCDPRMPLGLDDVARYHAAGADQVILMGGTLHEHDLRPQLERWAVDIVEPATEF